MPGMMNNMLKAFWTIPSQSFTALDSSYIKEDSHGEWELSLELPEPGEVIWSNLPSAYRCLLWYDNTVVTMNTQGFLPLPAGKHNLKLVLDAYTSLPGETQLLSNYPNPCNPETWIPYRLSEDSEVSIIIHDVSGREVRRINLGQQFAGEYVNKDRALYWDGRNERGEIVSSGLYFYTLKAGGISQTGKMVIVR